MADIERKTFPVPPKRPTVIRPGKGTSQSVFYYIYGHESFRPLVISPFVLSVRVGNSGPWSCKWQTVNIVCKYWCQVGDGVYLWTELLRFDFY